MGNKRALKLIVAMHDHVVGVVDWHVRGEFPTTLDKKCRSKGWVVSQSFAKQSVDSIKGFKEVGGVLHKPLLQTVVTTAALGEHG